MLVRLILFAFAIPMLLGAASPNILFIVSDDQRPDTVAALGNANIRTPNLDRLVARGTSFTRAYATYPICHVSRAQILTGTHAFRAYPNYPTPPIDSNLPTMAQTFTDAGYQTWYTGKWHNDGQPKNRGYTGTRGLYSSGGGGKDKEADKTDKRGNPVTGYRGWTFKSDDGKAELEKGVGLQTDNSRHVADGAIAALRDTPAGKPFLLHVNFAFPHDPRMWPPDPAHRYDAEKLPLPANFAAKHPFDHGNIDGRDELLLPTPRTEAAVRMELAIYYAMITDMDAQLGRILDALDASGHSNDTIVVFTSDQGLALGSHGLLGKQNQYEHSIRSPLIIAGPGLPAGRRTDALACLNDLFPTFCDLTAVPIPATVQGRSVVPLLRGQTDRIHDFVTGAFTDTQRMICDSRWKLIVYPKVNREQLFDLQNDPNELNDLSGEAAHRAQRDQLHERLRDWCQKNGDRTWPP